MPYTYYQLLLTYSIFHMIFKLVLCRNNVVQPGSNNAVEQGVYDQHDQAARDWQA